ncbi:uncharacterized protein LTR77_005745 [Saxophila tyrrhenica]|uniref:Alpha/beta hydrolase fold-3 domain-containing protein n=1 Tax=Saxophila tyrrhenica TaxID=1690608 RepID=A0AAV9P9Z1_9PEZI|nr:hypothetical protein LTR77_005745 [Saxophila tyrrhenica]
MSDDDALREEYLAFGDELGFLPKLHGPSYEDLVAQDTENTMALLAKYTFPGPDASVERSEHKTSSGIRLKAYRPDTLKPGQPLVYYIHGGGFAMGSVDLDDRFCDLLSKATGCIFVSVEYRLAPAFKHPVPLDDCVEGAKWCVENAASLGAKAGGIVIAGKSAGGGLVFGTALRLVDEGRGGDVAGLVPCQPLTVHPDAVPEEDRGRYGSYDENELHAAPLDDPYIWPLQHKNLAALPKTYMNGCGADTLRDDARLMKDLLDLNGVPNQYEEYEKLPHYFFVFPSSHLDKLRDEYFDKTAKGILWVMEE